MNIKSLVTGRKGFWRWSMTFFVILGGAAIAKFLFDGRSLIGELPLLLSQLAATFVFALPAGFLVSGLSRGCIVCRDDVCETDEK